MNECLNEFCPPGAGASLSSLHFDASFGPKPGTGRRDLHMPGCPSYGSVWFWAWQCPVLFFHQVPLFCPG